MESRDSKSQHGRPRWIVPDDGSADASALAAELNLDPIIGGIIVRRGISTPQEARKFLRADIADLSDPMKMADMEKAVSRIISAIRSKQKICIYGDYDADGVSSTALMLNFLRRFEADVTYYIPDREKEGYGLKRSAVEAIAAGGTGLIITVDCGVSAVEEIAAARKLGVDVIVVDHHQVPHKLPEAEAVLNPHRSDCAFPFKDLAAVGVSFFLLMALRKKLRELGYFTAATQPNLREYLDLVVLGTVADVVPLLGDNRILVRHGLKELSKTRRKGIMALKEVSGVSDEMTAQKIGFRLAPRLNAAGRLEDAKYAVELLSTADPEYARNLAEELNWQNARRQKIEEEIFNDVIATLEKDPSVTGRKTIVAASEAWHPGVIGIVASRVMRRFQKPAVLIALKGGKGRGSGRSVEGFHLFRGFESCGGLLEEYGGHKSAAGLSIREAMIGEFREALEEAAKREMGDGEETPKLLIDSMLDPVRLDDGFMEMLSRLEPHGTANPQPMFASEGVNVLRTRLVGPTQQHLKMVLSAGGKTFDSIFYGMESRECAARNRIDVAYTPEFNEYMGAKNIQLRLHDFRPCVQAKAKR